MARPRRTVRGQGARARSNTSKRGRADNNNDEAIPAAFRELLADAKVESLVSNDERPLKRRKVGDARAKPVQEHSENESAQSAAGEYSFASGKRLQTVVQSSESEASDLEWEDVALETGTGFEEEEALPSNVSIVIGEEKANGARSATRSVRPAVTAAIRKMRLDIHKMHICCLLHHNFLRNSFCDDRHVQAILSKMFKSGLRDKLNPSQSVNQSRRTYLFKEGLNLALELWKGNFRITRLGLKRPHWTAHYEKFELSDRLEIAVDRVDFRRAARELEGSADLGAQLFCALLRSAGVTTRLICSLQPLTFGATGGSVGSLPARTKVDSRKTTLYADELQPSSICDPPETIASGASTSAAASRRIVRFGQQNGGPHVGPDLGKPPPSAVSTLPRLAYPLYWVEAFSEAQQKWICIDPVASLTVGKPSRLEPPLSDPINCMSYVIAFESDGSAHDVTRRYAKAFNAKTRKLRVESCDGGQKWLKRAMKLYRRREKLDRDQIEDDELAKAEAREGMPRNIQDFKNHPYYVLDRHLRRTEIIHPKREVGKVNVGSGTHTKLEAVYRRQDLHVLRSLDRWYRMGREVRVGEAPLKVAKPLPKPKPRGKRDSSIGMPDPEPDDETTVALYADFQTELYVAPPVVRGRVPRNGFGNLDVYVPSMVPPGGVHIRAADAAKAARILGVDYADAVTGFKFQGRQGTAIVEGVVVAREYEEAMVAVLIGLKEEFERKVTARRAAESLRLWRRFLIGLRVAQRVDQYLEQNGPQEQPQADIQQEMDRFEADMDLDGGGFIPSANPTNSGEQSAQKLPEVSSLDAQRFLPQGSDLYGFEHLELTPSRRPRRQLIHFDEDTEDETLHETSGSAHRGPRLSDNDLSLAPHQSALETAPLLEAEPGGSVVDDLLSGPNRNREIVQAGGSMVIDRNTLPVEEQVEPDHVVETESVLPMMDNTPFLDVEPSQQVKAIIHETAGHQEDLPGQQSDEDSTAESDEDRGSLLSEDPEDEDAEPEWLVNVIE